MRYDGRSKTKLYKTWVCMKRRCDNPDTHHKKYYQNIKIYDKWYNFDNFKLDGLCDIIIDRMVK